MELSIHLGVVLLHQIMDGVESYLTSSQLQDIIFFIVHIQVDIHTVMGQMVMIFIVENSILHTHTEQLQQLMLIGILVAILCMLGTMPNQNYSPQEYIKDIQ